MSTATPTLPLVQATASSSPRVEGREGGGVGTVHAYLLDKASGRTSHAVLSLGGFMGLGKSFYPVPFGLLTFDSVRDVYVVGIDKGVLAGGPSWSSNAPTFDTAYAERVDRYYADAAIAA